MAASELGLPGRHNLENAAAAAAIALALGADPSAIGRAVIPFTGLPHRLRLAGRVGRVSFYDDSKATNAGATVRAVEAFDDPVILLLGGQDKGGDFATLARQLAGRVRVVVTFGQAGPMIAERVAREIDVIRASTLEDAVRRAQQAARPGEIVLLAPACASFDAFPGYAARGDAFVRSVEALARAAEAR
jgi:UDP-N-acetylmuramoylalanine--D-glutamate ligase